MQRNVGLATNEDELRPQSITEGHLQLLLILTIAASPMNGVNVADALREVADVMMLTVLLQGTQNNCQGVGWRRTPFSSCLLNACPEHH